MIVVNYNHQYLKFFLFCGLCSVPPCDFFVCLFFLLSKYPVTFHVLVVEILGYEISFQFFNLIFKLLIFFSTDM